MEPIQPKPEPTTPPTSQFHSAGPGAPIPQVTGSDLAPEKPPMNGYRILKHVIIWGFIVTPILFAFWLSSPDQNIFTGLNGVVLAWLSVGIAIAGCVALVLLKLGHNHLTQVDMSTPATPTATTTQPSESKLIRLLTIGGLVMLVVGVLGKTISLNEISASYTSGGSTNFSLLETFILWPALIVFSIIGICVSIAKLHKTKPGVMVGLILLFAIPLLGLNTRLAWYLHIFLGRF